MAARRARRALPQEPSGAREWFREGERTDRFLQQVVRPDTHCIDIGCHIGSFLQKLTTIAPHGPPLRRRAGAAEGGPAAREISRGHGLEVALGESHGTAEFFINQSQTSYSGLKKRAGPGCLQAVQVQCRKLDEVIPADAHIGFIKIDVNGAESMVLRGALELLRRDRPAVLLECTQGGLDDYGVGSDDVYDFLVGPAGYKVQLLKDHPDGPALDAAGFRDQHAVPVPGVQLRGRAGRAGAIGRLTGRASRWTTTAPIRYGGPRWTQQPRGRCRPCGPTERSSRASACPTSSACRRRASARRACRCTWSRSRRAPIGAAFASAP
jgi:FkbM family methyltransferase